MPATDTGYSLLELLVTIAVAALILALGIPSFAALNARHAQRVELNALFHAIHLARKASIMRRQVVSLCPSVDGRSCTPGQDWSGGFLVFENGDRDEPPLLDYNLDRDRDPATFDSTTPWRASDHDPVIIGLDLTN